MNWKGFLVLIAAITCTVTTHAQNSGSIYYVPVKLFPQLRDNWCWAASGQMLMRYFDVDNVSQCDEADRQVAKGCCSHPASSDCDRQDDVKIELYPSARTHFTYHELNLSQSLSKEQIKDQITIRNEPWSFRPYWGLVGHRLVGSGYYWPTRGDPWFSESQQLFFILVADSWPTRIGSSYLLPYWDYKSGCWWGNGNCTAYPVSSYSEGYDIYDINPPAGKSGPASKAISLPPLPLSHNNIQHVIQGDHDQYVEAKLGWQVFQGVANSELGLTLGFGSKPDNVMVHFDGPVQQYDVLLSMLRSWDGKNSANDLMLHMPTVLVPVTGGADRKVCAILRLRLENELWRLSAFGNASFCSAWEKAHRNGGEFVVMVEGLEIAFAGKRDGNRVLLSPLFSDRNLEAASAYRPAEDVLHDLMGAAKSYRGWTPVPPNQPAQ